MQTTAGADSTMSPTEVAITPPFYTNELILQNYELLSVPSEDQFAEGIATLITHYQVLAQLFLQFIYMVFFICGKISHGGSQNQTSIQSDCKL